MPNAKLTILRNRAHPSEKVRWEVVLYQNPRHLQHYGQSFKTKWEAMQYASLEVENPNWSEVVVHAVLAKYCPAY